MKTIKVILAILFALATMMLCGIDTDYTPISHVLGLVAVWIVLGIVVTKIDCKNE